MELTTSRHYARKLNAQLPYELTNHLHSIIQIVLFFLSAIYHFAIELNKNDKSHVS